eukprot:g37521.t1
MRALVIAREAFKSCHFLWIFVWFLKILLLLLVLHAKPHVEHLRAFLPCGSSSDARVCSCPHVSLEMAAMLAFVIAHGVFERFFSRVDHLCLFRFLLVLHAKAHVEHLKRFSAVCVLMRTSRPLECWTWRLHSSQA